MFLLLKHYLFTLETINQPKKIIFKSSAILSLKDNQYGIWGFFPVHVYIFKVLTIMVLFDGILYI